MMYLFHGTARKVAIFPLFLSAIGWVIFVSGFGIGLRNRQRYEHNDYKPSSPQYYPFWAATCAGPFLFISVFVHAAIKPRPLGAIIQALTGFVSVLYLTAVGAVLFLDGVQIHEGLQSETLGPDEPSKFKEYIYLPIEFTGCLFSAIFWGVLSVIRPFYTDQKESEVTSKSPSSYYPYEGNTPSSMMESILQS